MKVAINKMSYKTANYINIIKQLTTLIKEGDCSFIKACKECIISKQKEFCRCHSRQELINTSTKKLQEILIISMLFCSYEENGI